VVDAQQRLPNLLDRRLTVAGVAGVDVGPQRRHHGDEPLPERAQGDHEPHDEDPPATMLEVSGLVEMPSSPRFHSTALMATRTATINRVSTAA
jgi:hypothetical protein